MRYTKLFRDGVMAIGMTFLMIPQVTSAKTLEEIRDSGVFTIGYISDQSPFSSTSAAGASGYSIELCQRVADAAKTKLGLLNLTLKYTRTTVDSGIELVANGQVDILCGAVTSTLNRRELVSFSKPIFLGGVGALLRTDSPIRLQALMEGKEPEYRPRWRASYAEILQQHKFFSISKSNGQRWLNKSVHEFKINVATGLVKDYDEGIAHVRARRGDVLFADRALLKIALAKKAALSKDLYLSGRNFTNAPLALVVRRGNDDLRLIVDRTLSGLYRSGEILTIYEQFFGKAEEKTRELFRLNVLPE